MLHNAHVTYYYYYYYLTFHEICTDIETINIKQLCKAFVTVRIITVKIITLTLTIQQTVDGIHQYYTQTDQWQKT